jgi:hypothetical protein
MSEDVMIVDNDQIQITIDSPTVVPALMAPVSLQASGFTKVSDNKVCIEGDEIPPSLKSPLMYMNPPYVVPGTGKVSVTLKDANKTSVTTDDGDKKILLKGSTFDAKFDVQSPAKMPPNSGSTPDPNSSYSGTAQFISTNTLSKAE